MAINVASSGKANSGTAAMATTLTLTLPALSAGQYYLVWVGWRNKSSDATESSPPSGWTEVYENIGSVASTIYAHAACYRRSTTASSFVVTLSAAGAINAMYAVINEGDTAAPVLGIGTAFNSASTNAPVANAFAHGGVRALDLVFVVTDNDNAISTAANFTILQSNGMNVSSDGVDCEAILYAANSVSTTGVNWSESTTAYYPVIARSLAATEYVAPPGPSFSRDGVPGANIASVDAVPGTSIAAVDGVTAQLQEWRKAA